MSTKRCLLLITISILIPLSTYGKVITKIGETCLISPSLSNFDVNIWSPQGNRILLISNKDSKYYNINVINSDGTSFQRLTDDTATSLTATWSKDGSKIYYESYYQNLDTLWSMNASGGNKTMLVQAPENYTIYQFSLSPNNTKIAYMLSNVSTETAKLYVMNTDGSNKSELTIAAPRYFGGFSWSNDSAKIIYYRGGSTSSPTLNIVTIDNTSDTKFIEVSESQTPKWQPNGNKILYLDYTTDNQIFSINSDGSGNTQLTTNEGYVGDSHWSPDGTKILFYSFNDNNQTEIWSMNSDGSNKNKIVTFNVFGSAFWSADSTKIVYSDLQNIWVTDTTGANATKITANSLPQWNFSPAFNGSYNKLVFCSINNDKKIINTIDADGTNQKELLNSTDEIDTVLWNPKSEQIIYTFYDGGLLEKLWTINSDGTNNEQLTTECSRPDFSPDGTKIVYLFFGVWIMNSDGTSKKNISSSTTYSYSSVSWSPAGDKVATEQYSNQTGGSDIYTITIDGNEKTNLTNGTNTTKNCYPNWSVDGSKIAYFVKDAPTVSDNGLWVMDNNGNNKKQLSQFYPPDDNRPKWDSTGRIYFLKTNQVFSIKPDGADLRAESGDNLLIGDFALSPADNKISYVSSSNIFVASDEGQITLSDSVNSNLLTIGNNVFNPSSGQRANIFIPTNLHDVTVKIFTITGTLVKKFESVSSSSISWDGKNEDGETVASGVYLVIMESAEKIQKEKIIILK